MTGEYGVTYGNIPHYYGSIEVAPGDIDNRMQITTLYCQYSLDHFLNGGQKSIRVVFKVPNTRTSAAPFKYYQPTEEQKDDIRKLASPTPEQLSILQNSQRAESFRFMASDTAVVYLNRSFWNFGGPEMAMICQTKAPRQSGDGDAPLPVSYLWTIRMKYGKQFTDNLVAFTLRAIVDKPYDPSENHFSGYLYRRMSIAESVVDSGRAKWPDITNILTQCDWLEH